MKQHDFHPMRRMARNPVHQKLMRLVRSLPQDDDIRTRRWSEMMMPQLEEAAKAAGEESTFTIVDQMAVDQSMWQFEDAGRNIVTAAPALTAMLARTDLGDLEMSDLKLPYSTIYVAMHEDTAIGTIDGDRIDGIYLTLKDDGIHGLVTTCWTGTARRGWPFDEERNARIKLHCAPGMTVQHALDDWMAYATKDFMGSRAAQNTGEVTKNYLKALNIAGQRIEANHVSIRRAVLLGLNIAAYMAHEPEDAAPHEQVDDAPTALASKATAQGRPGLKARQSLLAAGYLPVTVVGGGFRKSQSSGRAGTARGSVSAHWRRGHWRRQKHGPALSMVRIRWIMPVWIDAGAGEAEPRGRIYEVKP